RRNAVVRAGGVAKDRPARSVVDEEGDAGVPPQTLRLRRREAVDRTPPGLVRHRPRPLGLQARIGVARPAAVEWRRALRRDAARLPKLPPRQPAGESRPRHDALLRRSARTIPRPRRNPLRPSATD